MSISCSCGGGSDYPWYYMPPNDYSKLDTPKRKRCKSCGELIDKGATCGKFVRFREPNDDIEERIHGDEVYLAPWFMCEDCTDFFFSLEELGYCIVMDGMPLKEMWRDVQYDKELEKQRAG